MIGQVKYIFFDIKNNIIFKIIYFLEKISKFVVLSINNIFRTKIKLPFFLRKDYNIKNSDGLRTIKKYSDHDTLISPLFESELRDVFQVDSGIFIDIGTHVGKWSIYIAKQNKNNRVISFEANPQTYKYLIKNINNNQLNNQIIAYNLGISSKSGNMDFYYDTLNTGTSTVVPRKGKNIIKEIVSVIDLDSFMSKNDINIDDIRMIKIDVEGHEGEVIKGMYNVLKNSKNIKIICEINPTNTHKKELIDNILGYGFKLHMKENNSVDHIFTKK